MRCTANLPIALLKDTFEGHWNEPPFQLNRNETKRKKHSLNVCSIFMIYVNYDRGPICPDVHCTTHRQFSWTTAKCCDMIRWYYCFFFSSVRLCSVPQLFVHFWLFLMSIIFIGRNMKKCARSLVARTVKRFQIAVNHMHTHTHTLYRVWTGFSCTSFIIFRMIFFQYKWSCYP